MLTALGHENWRDVGRALQEILKGRTKESNTSDIECKPLPSPARLPQQRLLRSGEIGNCTWEELGCPKTIINLRNHEDNNTFKGVRYVQVKKAKDIDCFETGTKDVRSWLVEVLKTLEDEKVEYPILFHCRKGKDRTGVIIACLLKIAGVPDDIVIEEYMRSKGANKELMQKALDGWQRAGSTGKQKQKLIERRRPASKQNGNGKLTKRKHKKTMRRRKMNSSEQEEDKEDVESKEHLPSQASYNMEAYFRKQIDLEQIMRSLHGGSVDSTM